MGDEERYRDRDRTELYDLTASQIGAESVTKTIAELKRDMVRNASKTACLAETTVQCGKGDRFMKGALFRILKVMDGVQSQGPGYTNTFNMFGPVDKLNCPSYDAGKVVLRFDSFEEEIPEVDEDSYPSVE